MKCLRSLAFAALLPLASGAAFLAAEAPADASVVVAVTFEALVRSSSAASVATPVEQRSVWENGRIYTYTRVHVERPVAGALAKDAEAWVRTLGGVVGDLGQSVEGEPVLTVGRPSLLFVHDAPGGNLEVTARAQGQFPVAQGPDKALRLVRSRAVGVTLPPRLRANPGAGPLAPQNVSPLGARGAALAADVLTDRSLDDAAKDITDAWGRVPHP